VSGIANPARGEASILVGGERLVLRPSFEALVAAEEELGPLFALVERAAAGGLKLAEMAALSGGARTPSGERLAELQAALEALAGPRGRPLGRGEMDALRERFPD
jgi:Phage tail tube protein, GTA-gp10